jgi:predicted enzyme related to lactoylglutathione lyase
MLPVGGMGVAVYDRTRLRRGTMEFLRLTPSLIVDDVERSLRFYEALGFTRIYSMPERVPFSVGVVQAGTVRFMFWERRWMTQSMPQVEHATTGGPLLQYVEVRGVDELYARVRELGVDVLQEIETKPDGMRDFKIQDPDGWRMMFAERV